MSREVRMVTRDWEHPVDAGVTLRDGRRQYVPFWRPLLAEQMEDIMPPSQPRDLYQMYETVSEGTPISPPMASPEGLAQWLAQNGASAFADYAGTYDQWLAMIRGSGATVSAVLTENGWEPGWLDEPEAP